MEDGVSPRRRTLSCVTVQTSPSEDLPAPAMCLQCGGTHLLYFLWIYARCIFMRVTFVWKRTVRVHIFKVLSVLDWPVICCTGWQVRVSRMAETDSKWQWLWYSAGGLWVFSSVFGTKESGPCRASHCHHDGTSGEIYFWGPRSHESLQWIADFLQPGLVYAG